MEINLTSLAIFKINFILRLSKSLFVSFTFLSINSCVLSPNPYKDSLALDESIRAGQLPNGFRYYLKPTKNTDKIYFNFYVKVGNYNEHLSQYQFAHLVEHLGYSKGYQKAYLQNDLSFKNKSISTYTNANTSNAFTTYYSSSHAKDTMTIENRLQWFYDISNMVFEDSLILREARCLRQEVFSRSNGMALNKKFNKSIYNTAIFYDKNGETPYSSWLSTYDMGGISVSSVREFYHQWYRPDRMGLIITGNIKDIEELEQYLINLYSQIPKVKTEHDEFNLQQYYLSASPRFKVIERKEVNRFSDWNNENSEILLFFRVKKFNKTLETKEKWINKQLYQSMYHMIHQRLKEKGVPSWLNNKDGIVDVKYPDIDYPYFRMPALVNQKGAERKNLKRVISILQQLYTSGFTPREWNNQKQLILNQIKSKDINKTNYWENEMKNHFVYSEIIPVHKKAITGQWIDNLTLDDINSYLKKNFSVMPDDIFVTASSGHLALSFIEKQMRGWIKDAIKNPIDLIKTNDITSITPVTTKSSPLMSAKKIESLTEVGYEKVGIDPDTGFEVLELDNGVKVMLGQKTPNRDSSESISVKGTSPRGASNFPKSSYYAAISATEIVKLSGAGEFSRDKIHKKLGKEYPLNTEPVQLHIKDNTSTITSRAKLEDFEKYLQLIYLYFTSPRKDSLAFTQWQAQSRERYLDLIDPVNPNTDFKNAIADFLNISFFKPQTNLMSTQQFYKKQDVSYAKALQCYRAIFGNASDFTFVVKGSYEKDQVLPLLQKYLGNLPANNNTISSTADDIDKTVFKLPEGPVYHTFYADKMNTAYKLYTTPYALSYVFTIHNDNWKDRVVLDLIRTYLLPKVIYELRYVEGRSLYSAYTQGRYSETNTLYSLDVYVNALDDELGTIRTETKSMIVELKRHGISLEQRDEIMKNPLFYGNYASNPKFQEKVLSYTQSLNVEDIKSVARKYLKENHQYEFVFRECEKNIVIQ